MRTPPSLRLHAVFKYNGYSGKKEIQKKNMLFMGVTQFPSGAPLLRKILDKIFDHSRDDVPAVEVTFCWQSRFRVIPVDQIQLQHNIPFSFSRKVLLTRAYMNGLTAELNNISV